jgi:hypothetical protein
VVSLIIAISTTTTLISSSVSKKKIGEGSSLILSCDAFVVIPQRQQRIIPRRRRNGRNNYYDNIRETLPMKINTAPICLLMKTQTSSDSSSTNIVAGTGNNSTIDGSTTTTIIGADYDNRQNDSKIVGAILAVGIILILAGLSLKGVGVGGIGNANEVTSSSVAAMTNVVDTVIPSTSTDLLAVTLGESIGGVIGAIFSVAINFILRGGKTKTEDDDESSSDDSSNNININNVDDDDDKKSSLLSQGISDSDYFIANSASFALFEAIGVPESIAKLSSIFVAAIPSQLVKVGAKMSKQKRDKESQLMLQLLREEQKKKKQKQNFPFLLPSQKKNTVNPKELMPVTAAMAMPGDTSISTGITETTAAAAAITAIDFVEVFADITRWLEYE